MTVWFASDLHLDPTTPDIAGRFQRFLTGPARGSRALFLLGVGVTQLSCAPHNIPSVKQEICRTNSVEAQRIARRILRLEIERAG